MMGVRIGTLRRRGWVAPVQRMPVSAVWLAGAACARRSAAGAANGRWLRFLAACRRNNRPIAKALPKRDPHAYVVAPAVANFAVCRQLVHLPP